LLLDNIQQIYAPLNVKPVKLPLPKCVLLAELTDLVPHSVNVTLVSLKMEKNVFLVETNVLLVIMPIPVLLVLETELDQTTDVHVHLNIMMLVKTFVHHVLTLVKNVT